MSNEINICKRHPEKEDTVIVIDTKVMVEHLDEEKKEVYVNLNGQRYIVNGNYLFPYILVD